MSLRLWPIWLPRSDKAALRAVANALTYQAARYDVPPDTLVDTINRELAEICSFYRLAKSDQGAVYYVTTLTGRPV